MQLSSLGNRWILNECEQLDSLAKALSVDPIVAEILARRGYGSPESARCLLTPAVELPHDPFVLSDMDGAANEMAKAIKNKERITIYGDYDADGLSSVACLVRGLRILGANVDWYIPNRLEDGYGISAKALHELSERGTKLICSVDCGITAVEEAKLAGELGLRLIITDHHQPGPELPDALAVVDPWRSDDNYPFKQMAGVGVTYNFLLAVDTTLGKSGWENRLNDEQQRFLLQFVALGTIADVVPLKDINRYYVRHGLEVMNKNPCAGIRAIGSQLEINQFEVASIGFKIAPCINAAGRLGSAEPALELLLCDDEDKAKDLAVKMVQINEERKQLIKNGIKIAQEQLEADPDMLNRKSIIVASKQFHHGVIGIVANNLLDKYQKPVYVIAIGEDGIGKSSGRSLPAVDLLEVTKKCGHLIDNCGGHASAIGLTITVDKIEAFKTAFEEAVNSMCQLVDNRSEIFIDAVITPDKLTLSLLNQIAVLKPFGNEWPEPVLLIKNLIVKETIKMGEDSLNLVLTHGSITIKAIQFNMFSKFNYKPGDKIDLVCSAEKNDYKGRITLQAKIIDFRMDENTKLLNEIIKCPEIENAKREETHPCYDLVSLQKEGPFQCPEPWSGDISQAKILFVSSNPSISEDDVVPIYNCSWSMDDIVGFYKNRFNGNYISEGTKALKTDGRYINIQYWSFVKKRAEELLKRTPCPGTDYALTEIVHCKSKQEIGVKLKAIKKCAELYMDRILSLSAARVIIVIGAKAKKWFVVKYELDDQCKYQEKSGKHYVFLPHPNARGGQKTINAHLSKCQIELVSGILTE